MGLLSKGEEPEPSDVSVGHSGRVLQAMAGVGDLLQGQKGATEASVGDSRGVVQFGCGSGGSGLEGERLAEAAALAHAGTGSRGLTGPRVGLNLAGAPGREQGVRTTPWFPGRVMGCTKGAPPRGRKEGFGGRMHIFLTITQGSICLRFNLKSYK